MAYIRCASGGGDSSIEIVRGTVTGSASGTFTVTSQQGKAPKRAQLWNASHTGAETGTSATYWNAVYPSTLCVVSTYYTNALNVSRQTINSTALTYNAKLTAVGADSVSFVLPSGANYASGTWEYAVEFE